MVNEDFCVWKRVLNITVSAALTPILIHLCAVGAAYLGRKSTRDNLVIKHRQTW